MGKEHTIGYNSTFILSLSILAISQLLHKKGLWKVNKILFITLNLKVRSRDIKIFA